MRYFRLVRYLAYWILAFFGLFLILPAFYRRLAVVPHHEIQVLEDGWVVERNEETRTNVRRSDLIDEAIDNGEAVLIRHTLPAEEIPSACIEMEVAHAALRVYLDDDPVFSYGEVTSGRSYPAARIDVPLPSGYAGKTLQIVLTGTKDHAFSSLKEIVFGNRTDLFLRRTYRDAYAAVYGAFFFLQGVILLGLSVFIIRHLSRNLRILFSGVLSLGAGLYAFAESGVFQLLFQSVLLTHRMYVFGLFLIPVGILGIVCDFLYRYRKGEVTFTAGAFTTPSLSDIPLLIGCGVVALSALIFVFVRKPVTGGVTALMIGCLIFEGSLLESLYIYSAAHLGETKRHLKLSGIAYTDALTGQSNRAHCEQFMRDLDAGKEPYYIINFDVNGLKKINDTQGHAEGDRFLKGFAQILGAYFKSADLIGRMGGDEFVVILKNVDAQTGADRADGLQALLYKLSKTKSAFKYEASYGCAHSNEVRSGKSTDVYRLADERMYEMKRIVHMRNGGNGRDD